MYSIGISNNFVNSFLKRSRVDFDGCFSIDRIPNVILNRKKFIIVVNTSAYRNRMGHFITLIKNNEYTLYLDPFGRYEKTPLVENLLQRIGKNIYFLSRPIQSVLSDYCGFYAIMFVFNYTHKNMEKMLFLVSNNPFKLLSNDRRCVEYIKSMIKEINII